MTNWLPVPTWEGVYEVSDAGEIRTVLHVVMRRNGVPQTIHPRVLKMTAGEYGHLSVTLYRTGRRTKVYLHRAVALAFIGPNPGGMEVCHNNGDAADNRVGNLRWDTSTANHLDTIEHGRSWHLNKTHCGRGHSYSESNTYRDPTTGQRVCRTCRAAASRRYRRRKALAPAPTGL